MDFLKSKKFLWWAGGILTAILIYWYFRHQIDSKIVTATGKADEWNDIPQSSLDGNKLLKKGSRGAEVSALQRLLKSEGRDLGTYGPNKDGIDGVFGSVTEAALLESRGVKETTLNKFQTTVAASVNDKLKNPEIIYN